MLKTYEIRYNDKLDTTTFLLGTKCVVVTSPDCILKWIMFDSSLYPGILKWIMFDSSLYPGILKCNVRHIPLLWYTEM